MSAQASMAPDARTSATIAIPRVMVSRTAAPVCSLPALGALAGALTYYQWYIGGRYTRRAIPVNDARENLPETA